MEMKWRGLVSNGSDNEASSRKETTRCYHSRVALVIRRDRRMLASIDAAVFDRGPLARRGEARGVEWFVARVGNGARGTKKKGELVE